MITKIKSLVSSDILSTVLLTAARIVTGPCIMLLIPFFLTDQMQGFWFTFASISALSIFADLGFTIIVTQFSAHEFAHLELSDRNELVGSKKYFDRLASFFQFVLKWSSMMVLITFPIIFIIGYFILKGEEVTFSWFLPWLIYVVGSGVLFVSNIIFSFFEGCKLMAKAQQIRFYALVVNFISVITCLFFGLNLYSLAISMLFNAITCLSLMLFFFKSQIKQLLSSNIEIYQWRKDVLKLLWKYAISWSSGYFMFQIFTPIAFRYYGAVVAGKVGITISLISAVSSVANVWLYVANPEINRLVSKNKIGELNVFFKKQVFMSTITYVIISITCITILIFIPEKWGFKQRFLDLPNIIFLLFAWLCQLLITAMATYLRAHKEEPLMLPSIISGLYVGLSTLFVASYFPEKYLLAGFYSSFLITVPWVFSLYKRKEMSFGFLNR